MDAADSYELDLLQRTPSRLKGFIIVTIVSLCSGTVVLGQLHSIDLIRDTVTNPVWFGFVWLAIWITHLLTIFIFSSTAAWSINNRSRIFVGCVVASACAIALDFSAKHAGSWTVPCLRIVQETGFALVSYALPATLASELPASAHVVVPLYNSVRGASLFFGAGLDNWLSQLSRIVPYSLIAVTLLFTAGIAFCLFDGGWDSYRRLSPRTTTLRLGWDVALVAFTSFVCFFDIVYFIMSLKSVNGGQNQLTIGYSIVLMVSALLYVAAAPIIGTFIRWLPPRGILYTGSLVATMIALGILEGYFVSPHLSVLLITVLLLSPALGVFPALMHMHLLDRISESIFGRHHVAAGRVVSVSASMGLLVASAVPRLLDALMDTDKTLAVGLLVPICMTTLVMILLLGTMAVEIQRSSRPETSRL